MPVSRKLRFEIFKRDLFTCQYCGRKTPDVVLEADHIIPVSKGGLGIAENLITSCFDCNRGKKNRVLGKAYFEKVNIEKELERQEQLKKYSRLLKSNREKANKEVLDIIEYYHRAGCSQYIPNNCETVIAMFIKKLGFDEVKDAVDITFCGTRKEAYFRYFCGVCWHKIKGTYATDKTGCEK